MLTARTHCKSTMSQQNEDDEGTVLRPALVTPGGRLGATAGGLGDRTPPPDNAEGGLSLPAGARVAEFEIIRRIGEGGFSIVYLAMDTYLERTVALKEYLPSTLAMRAGATHVQPRSQRHRDTFEAGLRSFVNEAKLLAQFDHPALVKVYRFWEANGTAYMVMPFYEGVTMKDAVRAMRAPPDEAWLLALLAPLTEALMVIHAEHCYHRDIAPDNVILLAGNDKPLLLDFGAARRVIGDMAQGLTVILKAGYAPVEQYAEVPGMKQGPWTDVYALAAVVYWSITGSVPPVSVGRMMNDTFVPLSQCAAGRYSAGFLRAIDRALLLRPEHRTPAIDALRQDLGIMAGGAVAAPPAQQWRDSEATVIRPVAHRREPPAEARRASPDAEQQAAPVEVSTQASPAIASARPPATKRGVWVAAALATTALAAGAWWVMRTPASDATRPAPGQASETVPTLPPAVIQQVPPQVTQPSPAVSPSVTEAASTVSPAAVAAAPPSPGPERSEQRKAAAKQERAQPDGERNAECARILQRLSLGESSPELVERLKALKCR